MEKIKMLYTKNLPLHQSFCLSHSVLETKSVSSPQGQDLDHKRAVFNTKQRPEES